MLSLKQINPRQTDKNQKNNVQKWKIPMKRNLFVTVYLGSLKDGQ